MYKEVLYPVFFLMGRIFLFYRLNAYFYCVHLRCCLYDRPYHNVRGIMTKKKSLN